MIIRETIPELARRIIDASPDPAAIVDHELLLLYCNRQYMQLARLSHRDLQNAHRGVCHDILHLEPCQEACLASRALALNRVVRLDEIKSTTLDLRVNWIAIPLGGNSKACIEILRDVTAESRMQANYKDLLQRERDRAAMLQAEVQRQTNALTRANEALQSALAKVSTLARTDPLTGLVNRRVFDEELDKELQRVARFGRSLALLIIDLDHFKRINDTHGHQTGDEALKSLAKTIVQSIRATDIAARVGGEEFAVIFPETPLESALLVAERIRKRQEAGGATTFSGGLAAAPIHAQTCALLFSAADKALYDAKHQGRNRISIASTYPS